MSKKKVYRDKLLGMMIITLLFISLFTPLASFLTDITTQNARAEENGLDSVEDNWIITSTQYLNGTEGDRKYVKDCNIIIKDDGRLNINNATLSLLMDESGHTWNVTVENGGVLHLWNSTLKTTPSDVLRPFIKTDVTAKDQSKIIMKHNSSFTFPGYVNIHNSYLEMKNSTFDKLDNIPPFDYLWDGSTNDQIDVQDNEYCPMLFVTDNSEVLMENSEINNYYKNENFPDRDPDNILDTTAQQMSWFPLNGFGEPIEELKAVNDGEYISVDGLQTYDEWYLYNPLYPQEYIGEYPYINPINRITSLYIQIDYETELNYSGGNFLKYQSPEEGLVNAIKLKNTTEIGGPVSDTADIWEVDLSTFDIKEYGSVKRLVQDLEIEIWNTDRQRDSAINVDRLRLISAYNNDINIHDSEFTVINSHIDVDFTSSDTDPRTGTAFTVPTSKNTWKEDSKMTHSVLRMHNTNFKSYGLTYSGESTTYGDPLLVTDENTKNKTWIYRWLTVEITNNQGAPMAGATLEANPENFESSSLNQLVHQKNNLYNNKDAWDYLNKTGEGHYDIENDTYVANEQGRVTLLLATDRINHPEDWPNSKFVGNYRLNVTYNYKNIWKNSSRSIGFEAFPALNETVNHRYYNYKMDIPLPDLAVEGLSSDKGFNIMNHTAVNLTAFIGNSGVSDVEDVEVEFTAVGENQNIFIGSTRVDVPGNSSEIVPATITWNDPTTGNYEIFVEVDPNGEFDELNENNNSLSREMVVNSEPDLIPVDFDISQDSIQSGNTLAITSKVENQGGWESDMINVSFYVDWNTPDQELIQTIPVSSLDAGETSSSITVYWEADISTEQLTQQRTITVYVNEPVSDENEVIRDNNWENKNVKVYTEANLYFNDQNTFYTPDHLIQENQEVTFSIEVLNSGGWNGTVDVTLFDGSKIDSNIINQTYISIESGTVSEPSSVSIDFNWNPADRGYHDIHLVINYEDDNQGDDEKSWTIPVFSEGYQYDLILNDTDTRSYTDVYELSGFVVVEENATLTIGGASRTTTFGLKMDRDHKYGMIVRDNGNLIINNAEVYSDKIFNINLIDDAELSVESDSNIRDSVGLSIKGENSPTVRIEDSTVSGEVDITGGDLHVENSEFTYDDIYINPDQVYIRNTTFASPLVDFVDTTGQLIGVSVPNNNIAVNGEGWLEYYRWIRFDVMSNASHPLSNAEITVSSIYRSYSNKGYTNEEGIVEIPVLTNNITASGEPPQNIGYYYINGNYSEDDSGLYSYGPKFKYFEPYSSAEIEVRFENVRLPDLLVNEEDITFSKDEITADFDLWINATIRNEGVGTANNIEIGYWVLNQDGEYNKIGEETLDELPSGEDNDISFAWTAEMTNTSLLEESRTIKVEINPDVSPLDDFDPSNNFATSSILIRSPPSFDFTKDMQLLLDGTSYTEKTINEMDILTIKTQIMNVGGTDVENASLTVSINEGNIKTEKVDLKSEGIYNLSYDWKVNVTGSQTIMVKINHLKQGHIYTNQTSIDVEIQPAQIFINSISLPKDPKTKEEVSVSGVVVNDEGKTLEGITINGYFVDNNGNKRSSTKTAVTNENGYFMMTFKTPGEGGKYKLNLEPEVEGAEAVKSDSFNVQGEEFPWWIVGVVVAAAIAGVVLVIVYFKFYGQGEIVECGNCGATIPADADKCPECGVEFDKDTVKCSECGEWIPADAEFCPECGAEFITTGEEVEEYAERMKNQYQKYKNKFRRKAEDEKERELTDEEFMDWWKDQPSYLTFDEWLEREELKRKEGSIECPECGALNSVDAAVCQKCGSTLIEIVEGEEEEEEEEMTEEMEEFTEEEQEEPESEIEEEKKEEEPQKKIKKVRRVKKQPKKKRVKKNVIKEPSEEEGEEEETEE